MMWLQDRLTQTLQSRHDEQLYRDRFAVENAQGRTLKHLGKTYLNFASCNYLGLSDHPTIIAAAEKALKEFGVGTTGSHLINGHTILHEQLEQRIAEYCHRSRALLFTNGYMANLALASAVFKKDDTIFHDKQNHASLYDATQLSGATLKRFPHLDLNNLDTKLSKTSGQRFIVSDAVFSMSGACVDLTMLSKLSKQHEAPLILDDAHGFACVDHGAISEDDLPVYMGTLSKALGCFGGFIAGSDALIDTLIQCSRTYVYTISLPPMLAAASLAALDVLQNEPWRHEKLLENIAYFKQQAAASDVELMPSNTPIQPILCHTAEATNQTAERLRAAGIFVTSIRPPSVPPNTSRLRITLSAAHEKADIDRLLLHVNQ